MADYQSVEAGTSLPRAFTLVTRAAGAPVVAGTVNYYLKALTGAQAGNFWRDSDQTWQVAETANAMTHQNDGHWTRALAASPWSDGIAYLEYAKESGDLHVPVSRHLKGAYTPSADSSRRVDMGTWLGVAPLALVSQRVQTDVRAVGGTAQTAGDLAALINALNNLSVAQVNAEVDAALNTAIPAAPTANSANDYLRRLYALLPYQYGITQVDDVTPSATNFDLNIANLGANPLVGAMLMFRTGALAGQARQVIDHTGAAVTVDRAFTEAPANGDFCEVFRAPANVIGKVLGGALGTITGTGARVVDASGNNVAPATTALSTANWTGVRAGYLDELAAANLPADVAAVKADTGAILLDTGTDGVVVATASKTGYALSAAAITAILDTSIAGAVTANTVREALRAARAQGYSKFSISGDTLTIYESDGVTAAKTFTLAPAGGPFTSRTPA